MTLDSIYFIYSSQLHKFPRALTQSVGMLSQHSQPLDGSMILVLRPNSVFFGDNIHRYGVLMIPSRPRMSSGVKIVLVMVVITEAELTVPTVGFLFPQAAGNHFSYSLRVLALAHKRPLCSDMNSVVPQPFRHALDQFREAHRCDADNHNLRLHFWASSLASGISG